MVSLKFILASTIKYIIFCYSLDFKSRGSIANFHFWFNKEKRSQRSLIELEGHSDHIGLANGLRRLTGRSLGQLGLHVIIKEL